MLNPVRAGMVKNAWVHRWSSMYAHLSVQRCLWNYTVGEMLSLTGVGSLSCKKRSWDRVIHLNSLKERVEWYVAKA